jgi:hypothetical protein
MLAAPTATLREQSDVELDPVGDCVGPRAGLCAEIAGRALQSSERDPAYKPVSNMLTKVMQERGESAVSLSIWPRN